MAPAAAPSVAATPPVNASPPTAGRFIYWWSLAINVALIIICIEFNVPLRAIAKAVCAAPLALLHFTSGPSNVTAVAIDAVASTLRATATFLVGLPFMAICGAYLFGASDDVVTGFGCLAAFVVVSAAVATTTFFGAAAVVGAVLFEAGEAAAPVAWGGGGEGPRGDARPGSRRPLGVDARVAPAATASSGARAAAGGAAARAAGVGGGGGPRGDARPGSHRLQGVNARAAPAAAAASGARGGAVGAAALAAAGGGRGPCGDARPERRRPRGVDHRAIPAVHVHYYLRSMCRCGPAGGDVECIN